MVTVILLVMSTIGELCQNKSEILLAYGSNKYIATPAQISSNLPPKQIVLWNNNPFDLNRFHEYLSTLKVHRNLSRNVYFISPN